MEIPKTLDKRTSAILITVLLVLGIAWRLTPHLPNFAPIGAIALLGGMLFGWKRSLLLLVTTLFVTDLLLGAYPGMGWTWLGFGLIVGLGQFIKSLPLIWRIPVGAFGSSIIFFVVSNFGTWLSSGMYTHDVPGFIQCYVMALPFYKATLLSDIFFFSALIGMTVALFHARLFYERRRLALTKSQIISSSSPTKV